MSKTIVKISNAKKRRIEKTETFLYQTALKILDKADNKISNSEEYNDPISEDYDHQENDNTLNSGDELFHIEHDKRIYSRMANEFDIKALVENTEYNRNLENNTSEEMIPLIKNDPSKEGITKSQFTRGFIEFCEVSNLTESNQTLLLSFLYNSFGGVANLPITINHRTVDDDQQSDGTEDSVEKLFQRNSKTVEIRSNLKEYQQQQEHKQKRFYTFNQCQNDCCLYIGKDKADLFYCPKCTQPRFRPCTKRNCISRNKHDCQHLLTEGIAYKNLFYRSLILLVYDLVSTKHFIQYITYCRLHVDQNSYSDVMDGIVAKAHLDDMNKLGNEWKREDPDNRSSAILVNLLLSEFYDGGQLFTSRTFDFWPLCYGVLNLPANLRTKIGIGYFLGALYTGKHSDVERQFISDFLCEELLRLFYGIEYTVNGQKYFIQARLILHILDTKAAEPVFGFQSATNSKFGCPLCRGVTGLYNGKRCVLYGHRNYLPQLHWLRFFGQTGYCCPCGFYDHKNKNQWKTKEVFWNKEKGFENIREPFFAPHSYNVFKQGVDELYMCSNDSAVKKKRKQLIKANQEEIDSICQPCDGNQLTKEALIDFLLPFNLADAQSKYEYAWFHTGDFSYEKIKDLFKKHLYYRHLDLRTPEPYERVSHKTYLKDAATASLLNEKSKAKKKNHVMGIQSLWYYFRLPYGDVKTQFTWPLVHAVTGFVVRMTQCILGNYEDSIKKKKEQMAKEKTSSTSKKTENEMEEEEREEEENVVVNDEEESVEEEEDNDDAPYDGGAFRCKEGNYQASKESIEKVSAWLDCTLLPQGLNDDWKVNFRKPKGMKMVQKLKMLSCYWSFIIDVVVIEEAFKVLFRMFANDINHLLALVIPKTSVESIQNCVIESVACWEGIMPPKENFFQMHQLVDLPSQIKLFGPPMGVNEFVGERMVSIMKKRKVRINPGGHLSFGRAIVRKQINHEVWSMKRFFNKKPVSFHPEFNCFIYNDRPFLLGKYEAISKTNALKAFEIEYLADTILDQIQRKFPDENSRQRSPFYRIYLKSKKKTWHKSFENVVSNELHFDQAEVKVAKTMLNFCPTWCKHATIYGIGFSSRGSQYRETGPPILDRNYNASPSTKSRCWYEKVEYSSWCKFQVRSNSGGINMYYGKINSFFSADSVGDETIKSCILVSITSFKCKETEKRSAFKNSDVVEEIGSLVKEYFVAAQDICPTRIGIIPFLSEDKAVLLNQNTTKKFNNEYSRYYVNRANHPAFYVMLSLNPEKELYQTNEIDDRSFDKYM
jgi:hypothetical protein